MRPSLREHTQRGHIIVAQSHNRRPIQAKLMRVRVELFGNFRKFPNNSTLTLIIWPY